MAIRTRGTIAIKKLRMRRRLRADGDSYEIPYVGLYADLEGQMPTIGSTVSGLPAGYLVEEVQLQEGNGGSGRMVVVAGRPTPNSGLPGTGQLGDTIYELDWYEERRPIEEHPRCGDLKSDRPFYEFPAMEWTSDTNTGYSPASAIPSSKNARQRTWDEWGVLNGNDYEQASGAGAWSLATYKGLKAQGYNDFPVAYPVARKTTYTRSRVSPTGNVWKNNNPPGDVTAPNGWYYVKSAERITKVGRVWTMVEEWRGYAEADDLFFL
jgi:hypothetical protein